MDSGDISKQILHSLIAFLREARSFIKFVIVIAIFVLLWFINDSTDFIRNYRISNKIDNIKEIEQIIQNPKIDTTTKKMIQKIEYRIIQRESVLEHFFLFFFDDNKDQFSQTKDTTNAGIEQTAITNNNSLNTSGISYKFNFYIHVFSSSWIGIFVFLFSIIWLLRERKNSVILPFIIMGMAVINIILFSLITLLFPKSELQIINYLVNALFYTSFQLIFLLVLLPKIIEDKESIINSFDNRNQV